MTSSDILFLLFCEREVYWIADVNRSLFYFPLAEVFHWTPQSDLHLDSPPRPASITGRIQFFRHIHDRFESGFSDKKPRMPPSCIVETIELAWLVAMRLEPAAKPTGFNPACPCSDSLS